MIKIYDVKDSANAAWNLYRNLGYTGRICFYKDAKPMKVTCIHILAKLLYFKCKVKLKIKAKIYGALNRNN